MYGHTLLITAESPKSKWWCMNKGLFKNTLTSTCQVRSVGRALDFWTSVHQVTFFAALNTFDTNIDSTGNFVLIVKKWELITITVFYY